MSENLSIDEIIKRAEEIKRETERQLEEAEKNLDEKAKSTVDDVVVNEKEVAKRIAKVYEKLDSEDEDVKEYVPVKKKAPSPFVKAQKIEEDEEDDDVKIVTEVETPASDKTNVVNLTGKKKFKLDDKADGKTKTVMFVSSSDEPEDEDELQEIPTIFAKEHIYDGYDAAQGAESTPLEEIGVQMTFEGFDDAIESVPKIDEEVAEQILMERRQEKVGKFRLFGPDETDAELGENKEVKEDYMKESDKSKFFTSLKTKRAHLKLKMLATLVLAVPMLLITLFKNSAYFPAMLSSHGGYFTFATILYVLLLVVNYNVIVHGFNVKHRLNYDFPIALVSVLILLHTLLMAFYNSLWIDNGVLLILAGAFGMLMSQLGKSRMMTRIIDNFTFITESENKHTVENITNAVDAEIISRGLLDDEEPLIKTSVKCDFPTNFMEISCKREEASRIAKIIFPLSFLFALVLMIILGITNNFNTAVNMSLCSLAITLPCCVLYLGNTMLCDISANLDEYGSRVCGYEGAFMAQGANAMVMEAADLFSTNSCEMHGIKTFGGTKVDQAIIYAAAVMTQTKSPLAKVFDSVIIGKQSILPPVDGITYEEKMGTSAWIYKRKVLVGNRDLLLRHGVNVPKESFERKYTIKGRKALYLAINGSIAAMFVVSYSAEPKLKRELRKLEKSGITIIVKSCDPYINEKSIAKLFNLPAGFIRVMNYSSARVYDKYSNMHVEKSPAYVVHDGTALGFVSAMRSAQIIVSTRKLIGFLTCFGSAIGFATVALLSTLEAYQSITALNIVLFQGIWNFFIWIIVKIRGLSL